MKIVLTFLLMASFLFAKDKVIAFAQDTMGNDWRVAQVKQMQEALSGKEGIKFIYKDAGGNTALQISHIEEFIAQKVDVIVTSPRDSVLTTLVAKKAKDANVPLVLITRGIESDDYTTFIRADDYAIGASAAEVMAQELEYKGTVLMLQGVVTSTPAQLRERGFDDTIKKYPNIKVIKEVANYLRAEAILAIDKLHKQGISYDGIYSHSDSMVIGAIMALEAKGVDVTKLPIVGIDFISESVGLLKSGKLRATFKYPTVGYEGAKAALDIIEGKKLPKRIDIPTKKITIENVDQIKPVF